MIRGLWFVHLRKRAVVVVVVVLVVVGGGGGGDLCTNKNAHRDLSMNTPTTPQSSADATRSIACRWPPHAQQKRA